MSMNMNITMSMGSTITAIPMRATTNTITNHSKGRQKNRCRRPGRFAQKYFQQQSYYQKDRAYAQGYQAKAF